MHNKIKATQAELKLSLAEMSRSIGHHSNYLSRALRDGVSTAKQAEIIKKLDDLISNVNADKEQYVLARYHDQEIAKWKKIHDELKEANCDLFNASSIKDFQINQLGEENLELKEIRDNLVNERNELQQSLDRACEQMRIAQNEFTALEASYENALERERHLSDNYDYVLKKMAAAKRVEMFWWIALDLVAVIVALALL